MGYGYRDMSPEELKGYAIEAKFDDNGVELTLYSGDIWHYNKYYLTFEDLKDWRNGCRYLMYADWLRSEFVRQVLKKPDVADNMPYSGETKWCYTDTPMNDRLAIGFHTFLTKWQV